MQALRTTQTLLRISTTHRLPVSKIVVQRSMASVSQNGNEITVNKIAGSLGAEVGNVDLRQLDETKTKTIRQALLDHKVIFFRNQDLTPEEFLKFSSHFGKPIEYPFVKGIDGYPEIIQVSSALEGPF
jgi:taurine dioxygenase